MAEQNPTPTSKVHVVNRKGVSNFLPQELWNRMAKKEDAQGWRNNWREIRPGETPADVAASANIPPEFRKVQQGMSQTPAAAKAGLQLTDDEKRLIMQKEIETAIQSRKQEIEDAAQDQAEKVDSELQGQIARLGDYIAQNHGEQAPPGSQDQPIDAAIRLLSSMSNIIKQLEAQGQAEKVDSDKSETDPTDAANKGKKDKPAAGGKKSENS